MIRLSQKKCIFVLDLSLPLNVEGLETQNIIVIYLHLTTYSNFSHPPFASMNFKKLGFCIPRIFRPIR